MIKGVIDKRSYSALYRSVASNQEFNIDDSIYWWAYQGDTLFFNSATSDNFGYDYLRNPTFVSEPLALCDIVGTNHVLGELPFDTIAYDHSPYNPDYNWDVDASRYSSLLAAIPSFIGRVSHREADVHERNVVHAHYTGSVGVAGWDFIHNPPGDYDVGFRMTVPNKAPNIDHFTWVTCESIDSDGALRYTPHYLSRDQDIEHIFDAYQLALLDCSDYIAPFGRPLVNHAGTWVANCEYRDIVNASTYEYNRWHVDISYAYRIWRGTPSNFGEYLVHIDFTCGFQPTRNTANPSGELFPQLDTWYLIDNSSVVAVDMPSEWATVINGGLRFGDRFTIPSLNTGFARRIYQVDDETLSGLDRYTRYWHGDTLGTFLGVVSDAMPYIRPSSFYASSDALDSVAQLIKANNLQNIQHLSGLLGLIPDLSGLSSIAVEATDGNPSAIPHLIDFLTSEILKARFERDPSIKDTREIIESDIVNRLGSLLKSAYHSAYGKFSYEFLPSELFTGSGRMVLEARAKVRIYFDVGTLLAGYLSANSVGLLPTLARFWSIVPFSFVVDWFTNMSKRLKAVDNQLLYATLGINWCLYSYKISYYPDEDELDKFGLVSYDPRDPFGIVVFQREFTHWMPHLGESKYDFLRPTHSPDPVTVAALVWTLI